MSTPAVLVAILILVVFGVTALVVEVVRLRARVAMLEKGREVVDRHIGRINWRLDGEPRAGDSDQHAVLTVHDRRAERH
jgi:hypothetical protein